MNKKKFSFFKYFLFILLLFITNFNSAKEILIYADSITYDEEQNVIAKGNAKIVINVY